MTTIQLLSFGNKIKKMGIMKKTTLNAQVRTCMNGLIIPGEKN